MSYNPQKQHAPIDDSVKIPAAIRAAANRASEIHKAAYQTETKPEDKPEDNSGENKPTDNPADNPAEKPVAGNVEAQGGDKDGGTKGKQEAPKPEAPKKAEAGQNPPAPASDDWEHKYKSIKPRFDQQALRLNEMNQRIMQLERMLEERAPAQQQQPTPDLKFKDITPEERETYGDDFLDVSARAAAAKLNPQIERLQAEIDRLKSKQENLVVQSQVSTRQQMYDKLDDAVPNWRDINRSPDFLNWVNEEDAFSGIPRVKMLREAFDKGDTNRVLKFFKGFLSDEAATDPAIRKPETPPEKGKVPLKDFAAPGRAKAPAASTPPGEKETITHAFISQFYSDVNRGKYRGNEKEKDRIERMIFQANNEGRVI